MLQFHYISYIRSTIIIKHYTMRVNLTSYTRKTMLALGAVLLSGSLMAQTFPTVRVAKEQRNFSSPAIERTIEQMQSKIADKEVAWLFGNCFPNTLDRYPAT